jgi:hypothetical protein
MHSDAFRPTITVAPERIYDLFHKEAAQVNAYTQGLPDELKAKMK